MAVVLEGITTSKGIREVLSNYLSGISKDLYITLEGVEVQVESVDLVWDGGEYYIECRKTTDEQDEKDIYIYKLDNVLPLIMRENGNG